MRATLLLADDSVTIQRVIELTFNDGDVRVIAVGDGEQAIRRIDAEPPDIVLADVGMPKVDGYGVSSHVKRSAALRHIPVLLLTGAFDPIDEAKAAACECDGVLVKPFEPQALVSRVNEILAARPPRAPQAEAPRVEREPAPTVAPAEARLHAARSAEFWMPEPARPAAERAKADVTAPPPPRPHVQPARVSPPEVARDLDLDVAAVQRKGDDVFELGLDELDAAFSKLDPSAPAGDLDQRVASEFARDLDDLRGSPADASARAQEWDAGVSKAASEHAASEDAFEFETAALDQGLPLDAGAASVVPRAEPAMPPARTAPVAPPRQAPPEWEAELLRDPAPRVPGAAMGAPDFGDWDLPARPASSTESAERDVRVPPVPHERIAVPAAPAARVPPPVSIATPVAAPAPKPVVAPAPLVSAAPPASPPAPVMARSGEREWLGWPAPTTPAAGGAVPAAQPPAPRPAADAGAHVSIATAFAALLAAEQKQPAYRPTVASPGLSDAVIDEVVRRVVARMSDDTVQKVVLDTAERLVRDEINKIKENPE